VSGWLPENEADRNGNGLRSQASFQGRRLHTLLIKAFSDGQGQPLIASSRKIPDNPTH
jgi:hypothetical protein